MSWTRWNGGGERGGARLTVRGALILCADMVAAWLVGVDYVEVWYDSDASLKIGLKPTTGPGPGVKRISKAGGGGGTRQVSVTSLLKHLGVTVAEPASLTAEWDRDAGMLVVDLQARKSGQILTRGNTALEAAFGSLKTPSKPPAESGRRAHISAGG